MTKSVCRSGYSSFLQEISEQKGCKFEAIFSRSFLLLSMKEILEVKLPLISEYLQIKQQIYTCMDTGS